MNMNDVLISRRLLLAGFATTAAAMSLPVRAQGRSDVLVLGVDISDGRNYDPGRMVDFSPPLTNGNVYETLVTLHPGDYSTIQPMLATEWQLSQGGNAWRFKLREDVKFWDGGDFTAEDVKFSLDRMVNLKDQPSSYASNIKAVEVVDPYTVDIVMDNPAVPLLTNLVAPAFAMYSKKIATEHGAVSEPGAENTDNATEWLNQNSAGTAAYRMISWERNSAITLVRNENWWGGTAPFQRVVIRHIADGAAQLLALRRGDIDAAFNLTAEQLATVEGADDLRVEQTTSLDHIYMTLTSSAELNPALAIREARQAVAHSIDYDGIIEGLIGGAAVRPPSFLPVGVGGATEAMTEEVGYQDDLEAAKSYLEAAGLPDGFEFEMSIANAAILGTNYQIIAQKIQSDLSRVGIKMNLKPVDPVNLRTLYNGGETQSVITFWNTPSPEPSLWSTASVQRVAKRVHWDVPEEMRDLVSRASTAQDDAERTSLYVEYQKRLIENANYITLLQPVYRIAVSNKVQDFNATGAGWYLEMEQVKPA